MSKIDDAIEYFNSSKCWKEELNLQMVNVAIRALEEVRDREKQSICTELPFPKGPALTQKSIKELPEKYGVINPPRIQTTEDQGGL